MGGDAHPVKEADDGFPDRLRSRRPDLLVGLALTPCRSATAGPDSFLDLLAEVGVDVPPVFEDPLVQGLRGTPEDVADAVVVQAGARVVVEYLTHQRPRLPEVVVLGVLNISGTNCLGTELPQAVVAGPLRVGVRAAEAELAGRVRRPRARSAPGDRRQATTGEFRA